MIYRKAKPDDIPVIVDLGMEALQQGAYERLVISRERVEAVARECVSAASNFAWVAEKDGVVVAAVCALVHPCMFYERNQATVVQFYTRVPGAGLPLLRQFLRWARGRPGIKMKVFTLEHDADPRVCLLLQRLGLKTALPTYIEF